MKKGCLKHRYYPSGLRREKRASGRTLMSYTYDLDGRKISQRNLTGIRTTLGTGAGSIVCDNRYTYDGNGNRLSKADRQGLTKYAYDANNQLVQVQYPQGGLENYSYDAAGNRLSRSADGIQENYHYDNCNRLIQMTRMTTQQEHLTYTYDRQGNMLSDGRNQYTYDDFGRLVLAVTAEGGIQKNCYDAEGLRAEMEENGRLVQFLYNENREVVAEKDYSGNIIRYIRGLGLISSDSENAKTYYHYVCDEQGSVSHIIRGEDKESGVSEQGREQDRILNQYEYDAFGNTISCKEQVENRFRYQGEQYDPITRQYYLRARYYNPVIGRFIQEDTYYGDGLNLYEYCRNNTITYKDPTGHNICATQRDLYHKYREEGMNPQEAYQKMRKDLGLDSKSGYKDSGVGNGKDPWRSYSSRNGSNILFLPEPSQSSFNVGERIVSKSVFENYIQGKSEFKLGSPGAESFFFNKPGENSATRSLQAAVNAGFTRQNIADTVFNGGNELVRIQFKLDKVDQIVVPGVSKISGGIGDGTIPGTNELFTGKGYTQNYLGEKGYNEYIATNAVFTQDDIVSYQYLGKIKK